MGWLVTRRCACGDHDDGGGARVLSRRRGRRSRHSVSVKRAGFHVTGPWRGFQGVLFVSEDWWVRVFWSSGPVDRPSDCLYVRTIPLPGCMDRRSRYTVPWCFTRPLAGKSNWFKLVYNGYYIFHIYLQSHGQFWLHRACWFICWN